jgi:hypothetical protein
MSRALQREAQACPARRGRVLGWAVAGAFLFKGLVWLVVAALSWANF